MAERKHMEPLRTRWISRGLAVVLKRNRSHGLASIVFMAGEPDRAFALHKVGASRTLDTSANGWARHQIGHLTPPPPKETRISRLSPLAHVSPLWQS